MITVKVTVVPWTNFDSQVQTMVQNHNYPDITEGDYFSADAQQGLLYPASQVLSDPGNLLPVFAKPGTYNGIQYGMPFTTSSRTLFYNKKLFAQGQDHVAADDLGDVQADAAKIKALGPIGFGLPLGPEEAQAESLLWFLGDGGNYMSAGKWTINSPPERRRVHLPQGPRRGWRHRAEPGHRGPHRRCGRSSPTARSA